MNLMDNSFEEIMVLYNKNFRDYNENMRLYIEIMKLREERLAASAAAAAAANRTPTSRQYNTTFPPLHTHTHRRIYPIHTPDDIPQRNLYNYTVPTDNTYVSTTPSPFSTIANLLTRNLTRQTNVSDLEDVVVYPSTQQLNRATEIIVFNRDGFYNNTTCPITLEPFIDGEQVCRIKHCSHIFKRDAIINWFSRNVRCPVCRYDIRDYRVDAAIIEEPDNENENDDDEIVEDVSAGEQREENRLSDLFTSAVRELLQEQIVEERGRNQRRDTSNNTVRTAANLLQTPIAQTITNSIRNFITNEISQMPITTELLYTFDIPITYDLSRNRMY